MQKKFGFLQKNASKIAADVLEWTVLLEADTIRGEVLQTVKFKKASIFTTLVIAVLMVYALISLFVVHRQTRQLQDRAATLQQQVSEMTQANAELQYQIDHSEDDDMIESVAREKLGLVKPGEKIFYDTSD